MPTVLWAEGYEHRTLSANDFGAAAAGGIFHTITGSASISFVEGRQGPGSWAIQFAPVAAACGVDVRRDMGAGLCVEGFYFKITSGVPAAQFLLADTGHAGSGMGLFIKTDGTLLAQFGGVGTETTAASVCDGNWHRVDYVIDADQNPWTFDLQVDDVAFTQITRAAAASAATAFEFRLAQAGAVGTYTLIVDDRAAGGTIADYPFGAHKVLAVVPSSDDTGASSYGVNVMEQGTGVDLSAGNQGWQYLDDWPGTNADAENDADHVTQAAGLATDQVTVNMQDTAETDIWGATAYCGMKADATTACNGTTRVRYSDATTVNVYSGDPSEVNAHYRIVGLDAAKVNTQAEFNGLQMQVGLSTDPAPDPEWVNLMVQYAVTEVPPPPSAARVARAGMIGL